MSGPVLDGTLSREAARRRLADAFRTAGLPAADLDARLLVCAAAGLDHFDLVRDPDASLGEAAAKLARFAERRLAREPVSRILGAREFWSARFILGPATLDPRPETETLVAAVLEHAGREPRRDWRLLDLGVGSGAILCALLAELPNAVGYGVDLAPDACRLARDNLAAQGLQGRGKVICAEWMSAIDGRFDVIVSNPPYVARGKIDGLEPEVRLHDPRLALDGGEDGLDAYRRIVPAAAGLLAPGGLLALEFGAEQGGEVDVLLAKAGFARRNFRLDLTGTERIIVAKSA